MPTSISDAVAEDGLETSILGDRAKKCQHTRSSHYLAPKRKRRSRLKITDGGLGTRLDLELRIEAST